MEAPRTGDAAVTVDAYLVGEAVAARAPGWLPRAFDRIPGQHERRLTALAGQRPGEHDARQIETEDAQQRDLRRQAVLCPQLTEPPLALALDRQTLRAECALLG